MADRFAWGAGELEPDADEVAESARLDEGRHSAWDPADHPRADDGKFGSGGGGSSGGSPSPAASSGSASHSGGGSPAAASHQKSSTPTASTVKTSGGTVAVTRNAGGSGGTINIGHGAIPLGEDDYNAFATEIGFLRDVKVGRTRTSKAFTVGTQRTIPMPDGGFDNGGPPIAVVKRTGDDTYTVHMRPHEGATPEEIADTPGIAITGRESSNIEDALKKFDRDTAAAARAAKAADKAEAIRTGRTNPADIARRANAQPPSTPDPDARGMPDTIVAAEIPSSGGDTVTVHRQPGNNLTHLSGNGRSVALNDDEIRQLSSKLDYSAEGDGDWPDGETQTVTDDNGHAFAQVTKNGPQFAVEVDGQPAFTVDGKAGGRIQKAADQMSTAQRVDTEYGSYDVFRDGSKFTVRHLGDDGRPVETAFDRRSWGGLRRAMSVVEEGFDDEDSDAPDSGVTSRDIKTNVGPVRIELKGGAFGTPGSRLSVTPAEGDDWGLVFDGPGMDDFQAAVGRSLDEAQKPRTSTGQQVPLVEAAGSRTDFQPTTRGRYNVLLIAAGQGSSGYYSEAVLRRDGPRVWPAGTPMHMDHPTPSENAERPEGSTLNWASVTTTDPVWDPVHKGLVAEVEVFPHWRGVLNPEFAKRLGLSIRASGTVEYGEVDGRQTQVVTSLDEGVSVDWVTRAGAGGKVLDLIESARSEGELLEKGNLAPPFTKGGGKAKGEKPDDDEDDDTGEDEDDDEDGEDGKKKDKGKGKKLPAFLAKIKAQEADLAEASNIGRWLESRIHLLLTTLADDMYGDGRLTRPERLTLSSAIGDGLTAFTKRVEADQPQLFTRDLWAPPPPAPAPTPGDSMVVEGTQGTPPTTTDQEEGEMPELTESSELTEARTAIAAAEQKAAAATQQLARFTAVEAARPIATAVLAESGLPAAAQAKILGTVTAATVPLGESNQLDEAALRATVTEAAKAEATYLASLAEADGAGRPRGLGESATAGQPGGDADPATTTGLVEAYKSRGLSAQAAELAAAGRPF